ncbi:methyltransferase domain-containing protein [Neobacillus mesonae]|nr:methyltransferase domain-containing protein [Neobacillus mesonae]
MLNSHYIDLLHCPKCDQEMELQAGKSLICPDGHLFDISKYGYINLLLRAHRTKYDKTLFRARKQLITDGKLEPLIHAIATGMIKVIPDQFWGREAAKPYMLLDAGCGEGSLLIQLRRRLMSLSERKWLGAGLDISKEGITLAAKEESDMLWCVADLARTPLKSNSFSFILSILSPSNYEEFDRLVRDDGVIVKVIPGSGYLQELRSRFYKHTAQQEYNNERTIRHFARHYQIICEEKVKYSLQLNAEEMALLIRMTPLSWGISEDMMREVLQQQQVTFDYHILYGKKKAKRPL